MAIPSHIDEQISKLQEIIAEDESGGWDKAWRV
jgi:hypothetical protein